jgi:FKBP-type peptidyl-prolyl cis-trans isomerase SlyD
MEIPRAQFAQLEAEASLEVGMQLVAQMPHGPSPFTITVLTDDAVTADFNHALAGKSLTFAVEIIELREATDDEKSHGHAHGPDGHHHH